MATASSAVVSDDIADVLGEVGILTASGEPVKSRDLWDQQELGTCLSTQRIKRAVQLSWCEVLAERLPFPVDILYADPDRKAYDVLGLYYGLGRTFFNPASTKVFSRIGELKKAMI